MRRAGNTLSALTRRRKRHSLGDRCPRAKFVGPSREVCFISPLPDVDVDGTCRSVRFLRRTRQCQVCLPFTAAYDSTVRGGLYYGPGQESERPTVSYILLNPTSMDPDTRSIRPRETCHRRGLRIFHRWSGACRRPAGIGKHRTESDDKLADHHPPGEAVTIREAAPFPGASGKEGSVACAKDIPLYRSQIHLPLLEIGEV